jgi:hypothetical protein
MQLNKRVMAQMSQTRVRGTLARRGALGLPREAWHVIVFTALCVAAALLIPAMPQPLDYHDFADQRAMLGIPNFMDVTSNAGFVLVGLAGLAVTLGGRGSFEWQPERLPYTVFFVGIALTGVGSAYYHLAPDNESLVWDRLPMTVAFMSLVAAQIGDRVDARAGLAALGPMLAVGAWTVFYWIQTERAGAGNVIPYAVLQGYSMVILLAMALVHESRYTRGRDIAWVFAWYLAAKVFEELDRQVFALGGIVSGHTLKHVAGAVAALFVVRMLVLRVPQQAAAASA